MHAAKIVIREMQRNGCFQVRQFLTESIREPRESANRHAHREVLALHKRRADMVGIGRAQTNLGYNLRDSWWGVPRFSSFELPVIAKQFHELREICLAHYPGVR